MQPTKDGGFQRIPHKGCAGTDAKLVEMVKQYRANTGIDMGDVEGDVAEYIRAISPINDRRPGKPRKVLVDEEKPFGFRPYINRIRDWLISVAPKQPRLLIEDEADERAQACMKCKHNVPWRTGCLPCNEQVLDRSYNVRQRPDYKHDDNLGACRLHDFHNPAAVFIDREFLPKVHKDAPAECWMKTDEEPDRKVLRPVQKAPDGDGPEYLFFCPACGNCHGVWTGPRDEGKPVWTFNGNMERPTFSPSLKITEGRWTPPVTPENLEEFKKNPWPQEKVEYICHLNVTDGQLVYHGDSTHALAGKTIPMEAF